MPISEAGRDDRANKWTSVYSWDKKWSLYEAETANMTFIFHEPFSG